MYVPCATAVGAASSAVQMVAVITIFFEPTEFRSTRAYQQRQE